MRSFSIKEIQISLAVREIFRYKQTDRDPVTFYIRIIVIQISVAILLVSKIDISLQRWEVYWVWGSWQSSSGDVLGISILTVRKQYLLNSYSQGTKGIRQWTTNWCTYPISIITPFWKLKSLVEIFGTNQLKFYKSLWANE